MRNLVAVILMLFSVAVTQEPPTVPFVLDASKPYVYVAFDHVARRRPVELGETKQGLWLRFVNNCRVPVNVGTFDPGTDDPGTAVIHEVVPLLRRQGSRTNPPEGYSSEVYSLTTVNPGESLLFSVPLNHVAPDWYLRVRFTLAVSPSKVGDQPYSFADFRWEQLPEDVRGQKK